MFLSDGLKATLGGVVLAILALGYAARRYPRVAWLQPFDLQRHVDPEQRERRRRSGNIIAGAQLILLGMIIPLGYLALTVVFFNAVDGAELAIALAAGVLCILLGITAIVKNRRRRERSE